MNAQPEAVPDWARPQERMASERQIIYIKDLLAQKDVSGIPEERLQSLKDRCDRAEVSFADAGKIIPYLKGLPRVESGAVRQPALPGAPQGYVEVAHGRYAVEFEGVLKFYRVNRPGEGTKWSGYTFLDVQASDDYYPIRDNDKKGQILRLIAADPKAAAEKYGQELGACGICGRTLTDETSRAIGIGPVCRGKSEWY